MTQFCTILKKSLILYLNISYYYNYDQQICLQLIKRYTACIFLQVIIYLLFSLRSYLQASFFDFHVIHRFPFFDFHVIHKLPVLIYMLFTSFLSRFTRYFRAPFLFYMLLQGSFFRFTCYFQALFFDFHVIFRPSFLFYMLFTAFFFDIHAIYMISSLYSENLQCFLHYLQFRLEYFHVFT